MTRNILYSVGGGGGVQLLALGDEVRNSNSILRQTIVLVFDIFYFNIFKNIRLVWTIN